MVSPDLIAAAAWLIRAATLNPLVFNDFFKTVHALPDAVVAGFADQTLCSLESRTGYKENGNNEDEFFL
jgi:hypothetical protein